MSEHTRQAAMRRYNATPEDLERAEALFDATPPLHHKSSASPFERWLDPCQTYFLNATKKAS